MQLRVRVKIYCSHVTYLLTYCLAASVLGSTASVLDSALNPGASASVSGYTAFVTTLGNTSTADVMDGKYSITKRSHKKTKFLENGQAYFFCIFISFNVKIFICEMCQFIADFQQT